MSGENRTGLLPYLDQRIKAALERAGIRLPAGRAEPHPPREVWNAETRALYRSNQPTHFAYPVLLPLVDFYRRLSTEIESAATAPLSLTVAIFQTPLFGPGQERRRRELEIALRLGVRRHDLTAQFAENTLAAALLKTREGEKVAQRLRELLTGLAEEPVALGVAHFPSDGRVACELLRVAMWRSLGAVPGASCDPHFERLLGPLGPSRAETK